MIPITGAIFDMDGVLVDNASYHIRAWIELGKELGKTLTDRQVRSVFGRRNSEMLAALIGKPASPGLSAQYCERKEVIYRKLMTPALAPVPGLLQFLRDLKTAGFKMAVATSGPTENVNLVMIGLGLKPWFDVVVTGDEVFGSKPDPDIFLLAAQRLDLSPRQCLVFEDSLAGIEGACRAGSLCFALTTTHNKEELRDCSAFRIISDYRGLRAANLRDLR